MPLAHGLIPPPRHNLAAPHQTATSYLPHPAHPRTRPHSSTPNVWVPEDLVPHAPTHCVVHCARVDLPK